MIGGIYLLTLKGDTILGRLLRGDLPNKVIDSFKLHLVKSRDLREPVWKDVEGTTFYHIKTNDVILVAATAEANVNVAVVFELLYQIVSLFSNHLGNFDEETCRNNFIFILEIIDEILDFGYPQNTGVEVLKMYVTQKGLKSEKKRMSEIKKRLGDITGAVSWREQGIRHKKNEIFIDCIESVNALISPKGDVLESDVSGVIQIKCFLSGMPECRFGLNDKLLLEKDPAKKKKVLNRGKNEGIRLDDVTFHQCVKLSKFDQDRIVSFVPPDGEFDLMKYRSTETINLPFKLFPNVKEIGSSRVEYQLTIKSEFSEMHCATNVIAKIPVPTNAATTKIKVSSGKAKYVAQENALVWKM